MGARARSYQSQRNKLANLTTKIKMTEHMNIEAYRKETGVLAVRMGQRMTVEQYWKENGLGPIKSELRRSKYNAKRTEYNGRMYDSIAEAKMAQELDNARHSHDPAQKVIYVEYQKPYRLEVNSELICRYIADFYVEYANGITKVIDAKGMLTPVYKLKKKLMHAILGIEIQEHI